MHRLAFAALLLAISTLHLPAQCLPCPPQPGGITICPPAPGNAPILSVSGRPVVGQEIALRVVGNPGDTVLVVLGLQSDLICRPLPGVGTQEIDLLSPLNVTIPLATVEPNGLAETQPVVAPAAPGFTIFAQAVVVSGTNFTLSNLVRLEVLEAVTSIDSLSPGEGEADVALSRETIVTFDTPIDPSTVNDQTFFAEFSGTRIPAMVMCYPDQKRVGLFYDPDLPPSTLVSVTLDGDRIRDAAGCFIDADGDGVPGGRREWSFSTVTLTQLPNTVITGRVLDSIGGPGGMEIPIVGATISVDGMPTVATVTDTMGNFRLDNAPAGTFFVHIDGTTSLASAAANGFEYPSVGKTWVSVPGRETSQGTIFLPKIADNTLRSVGASASDPVTVVEFTPEQLNLFSSPNITTSDLEGVRLDVPGGSLFANNGSFGGMVGIAPVPRDRLPGTLPPGLDLPLVITVQTDGPSNFGVPVRVRFPNLPNPNTGEVLGEGEKTALWSFNHDTGEFEVAGPATIVRDPLSGQLFAESDPGFGITAPGWHGVANGNRGDPNGARRKRRCNRSTAACVGAIATGTASFGLSLALDLSGGSTVRAGFSAVRCAAGTIRAVNATVVGCGVSVATGQPGSAPVGCYLSGGFNATRALVSCTFKRLPVVGTLISFTQAAISIGRSCSCGSDGMPDVVLRLEEEQALLEANRDFHVLLFGGSWFIVDPSGGLSMPDMMAQAQASEDALTAIQMAVDAGSPSGVMIDAGEASMILAAVAGTSIAATDVQASIDYINRTNDLWMRGFQTHVSAGRTDFMDRQAFIDAGDAIAQASDRIAAMSGRQPTVDQYDVYWALLGDVADQASQGGDEPQQRSVMFCAVREGGAGFVTARGRLGAQGRLPSRIVASNAVYSVKVYDPVQDLILNGALVSGDPGRGTELLEGNWIPCAGLPDSDGDGLCDEAEGAIGTSPSLRDTDADGIDDRAEILNGTDPLDGVLRTTGIAQSLALPGAGSIDSLDDVVVLGRGPLGVSILNAFNGLSPLEVARVDTPGSAEDIAFNGRFVAIADGVSGLAIVDAAEPATATLENQLDLGSAVRCVAVFGGLGLVGTSDGIIRVVDLASGQVLSRTPASPRGAVVALGVDDTTVVAVYRNWITTFDLVGSDLVLVGEVPLPAAVFARGSPERNRLSVASGRAFLSYNAGWVEVDVSDPSSPSIVSLETPGPRGWKNVVPDGQGNLVSAVGVNLGGSSDVEIYREASGSPAAFSTRFATPGRAQALTLFNGLAYVADGSGGLQVVNYVPFDTGGQAPSVVLRTSAIGGTDAEEGQFLAVTADVTDDVLVRNVDFFVDGIRVARDGSFPFSIQVRVPEFSPGSTFVVEAVAFDTGGNRGESAPITLNIVQDITPPFSRGFAPASSAQVPYLNSPDRVVAVFSEPIDRASIALGGLSLWRPGADGTFGTSDDVEVSGGLASVVDELNQGVLVYSSPLPPSTYEIRVSGLITDQAGNAFPPAGGQGFLASDFEIVDGDADGDGLTDFEELAGNPASDPRMRDTDGDGLTDFEEVRIFGSSPILSDTDGDGLGDRLEALLGSNPLVGDTLTELAGRVIDGGGMPQGGALVAIDGLPSAIASAATDASGAFSIPAWPESAFPITLRARGMSPQGELLAGALEVASSSGAMTPVGDLIVSPAPPRAPFAIELFPAAPGSTLGANLDLNGDGLDDVVAVDAGGNLASVSLAELGGGFAAPLSVATNVGPAFLASGRLGASPAEVLVIGHDGDGSIAILELGPGNLPVLRNVATLSGAITGLAVGDFDNDGNGDVVVVEAGVGFQLLAGDPVGQFAAPSALMVSATGEGTNLLLQDLDSDGDDDLAWVETTMGTLEIRPSGGASWSVAIGSSVRSMAAVDLDADGFSEILIDGATAGGSILEFDLDATLAPTLVSTTQHGLGASAVAVGDRDADGDQDLAILNQVTGEGLIWLRDAGSWTQAAEISLLSQVLSPSMSDRNGDGRADLVFLRGAVGQLGISLTTIGADAEAPQALLSQISPTTATISDFTGDGLLDLVATLPATGEVAIYTGNLTAMGSVGFTEAQRLAAGTFPHGAALGDVNSDGVADLVVTAFGDDEVRLFLGQAGGSFTAAGSIALAAGSGPRDVVLADLDGDGLLDLAVASAIAGEVALAFGSGGGAFEPAVTIGAGLSPSSLRAADLDADGTSDLFWLRQFSSEVAVARFQLGSRQPMVTGTPVASLPVDLQVVDLDRDGRLDLLVAAAATPSVQVLAGLGQGAFGAPTTVGLDAAPARVVAVDVAGDAVPEIAVQFPGISALALIGDASTGFQGPTSIHLAPASAGLISGDLDGDGSEDLILTPGFALTNLLGR